MYRRVTALLATGGALLLFGALHSPRFNAGLPSPSLIRSLAADYQAVDALYGNATSPAAVDAALRHLMPPSLVPGMESWRPSGSLTNSTSGIRLAQQAELAAGELGATAELQPIRGELVQSYQEAEQAWRLEQRVELSYADAAGRPPAASSARVQQAAERSATTIRQARSLRDQAMAAVQALAGSDGQSDQTVAVAVGVP